MRTRASSCEDVGTTWFFSSCGGILELRRGSHASSWVGPGKPNLPLELRGKAGGCARVTAGPKRPHLGVCPGPNIPLQGRQGSRGCCERAALNMPANLKNSAVTTGLEKVNFHSNPKERQCHAWLTSRVEHLLKAQGSVFTA